MTEIYSYIQKISRNESLTEDESSRLIQIALLGGASPTQIAAVLLGLRVKGESVDEIYGAYRTLSKKFGSNVAPYDNIFDVCGTGNTSYGNLNVSTATAFVVAGAGVKVAKHIDKTSVTPVGSTEVLKKLGVNVDVSYENSLRCLAEANICLTSIARYNNIMREIIPVIKDLDIKNIFNLTGPLVNPINCNYRLIGVYHPSMAMKIAQVLIKIGVKAAWVVCGSDFTDELSITGETFVAQVKDNTVNQLIIKPEDAGLVTSIGTDLEGFDPAYNSSRLLSVLHGEITPFRDAILLNTAASLIINEHCTTLKDGVEIAKATIDSGKALSTLEKLINITNEETFK